MVCAARRGYNNARDNYRNPPHTDGVPLLLLAHSADAH